MTSRSTQSNNNICVISEKNAQRASCDRPSPTPPEMPAVRIGRVALATLLCMVAYLTIPHRYLLLGAFFGTVVLSHLTALERWLVLWAAFFTVTALAYLTTPDWCLLRVDGYWNEGTFPSWDLFLASVWRILAAIGGIFVRTFQIFWPVLFVNLILSLIHI